MKVKFGIQIKPYGCLGAVTDDGYIVISKRACHRVDVFIGTLIHELTHWFFNCFGFSIKSGVHYWNDIIFARFFLYPYSVDREWMLLSLKDKYRRND